MEHMENNSLDMKKLSSSNLMTENLNIRPIKLKKNKISFRTNSTDYSFDQNLSTSKAMDAKLSPKKKENFFLQKGTKFTKSIHNKNKINKILKKSIIKLNINDSFTKIKSEKFGESLPKNINSFRHLFSDNSFGVMGNLNWALDLRNNIRGYKDDLKMVDQFYPPTFFEDDLLKFKKRQNKANEPLFKKLNPNFNSIRHLHFNKANGSINLSQLSFSSCLRNYGDNFEKEEKKWKLLPLPKINRDNFMSKILSPITNSGIENAKKLENVIPKKYDIKFSNGFFGKDKIKIKSLIQNRNYTICGFGDNLALGKYDNNFDDTNIVNNEEILKKASNPTCKFELGLRGHYKSKKFFKD